MSSKTTFDTTLSQIFSVFKKIEFSDNGDGNWIFQTLGGQGVQNFIWEF